MTRFLKVLALTSVILPATASAETIAANLPSRAAESAFSAGPRTSDGAPAKTAPGSVTESVGSNIDRLRDGLIVANLPARPNAPADAETIAGGTTRVEFIDVSALGLTPGITGTASIFSTDPLTVDFPITGGSLDLATLTGAIFHEGSGLTLTGGADTLGLSDFIIDVTNQTLVGDVSLNGGSLADDVVLFTFDLSTVTLAELTDLDNPSLALLLSADAAAALTQVFGAPDLTGTQIGLAATAPVFAAVPEPSSWAMMIGGFGLIGAQLRRRRTLGALAA